MGTRRVNEAALVLALLFCSSPAWAVDLTSAGGFLFDVMDGQAALGNGSIDAYDGCYYLEVDGAQYSGGGAGQLEGRLVRFAQARTGSLLVTRTVLVPNEQGRDYARYFDTLENPSSQTVRARVTYSGNLGSDSYTMIWGSSSGDRAVGGNESWFGTDDEDGGGDPTLAHLYFVEGAQVSPAASLSSDSISISFSVELGPAQSVSLLFFAFQGPSQAAVREQLEAVQRDLGGAIADLSLEERGRIANLPGFGLPSLAGVYEVETERGEVEVRRIYRAALRLAVRDVRARMEQAVDVAEALGGHLERQTETVVVLRVPAERFHEAMERLEALGDVLNRRIAIQAATLQVRDLRIRLRSAMDTRTRLLELLERSQLTTEALVIQREIERLNLLIQTLEAQLQELEDQIRFSTIAIEFQALVTPEIQPIPRDLFRLPFGWLDELGLPNLLDID